MIDVNGTAICSQSERGEIGGVLRKWPNSIGTLKVCLIGQFRKFSDIDARGAVVTACEGWSQTSALKLEYTSNPRTAHVPIDVGKIDGPGKTLGYAYLADGTENQKQMLLDIEEPYIIASNPPSNRFDVVAILSHELGHSCGHEHGPRGSLMQATYQGGLRTPQDYDKQQQVARYGEVRPEPPDGGSGGGADKLSIEIGGVRYEWDARRVA